KHIDLINIPSSVALGHVRYASRGRPVYENTHPLTDCGNQVAVVGDGVIENFDEIKGVLERKGHVFASRTDTEVFAHLVEDLIKSGSSVLQAVAQATKMLNGVYAAAMVVRGSRKIYVTSNELTVAIGLGGGCLYVSSDVPSLYGFSEEALILGDDMLAEVGADGVRIFDVKPLNEV
ncbi:MAG: glutamine--fructose-6-phosphate aminotransferase, partial [Zestosphaera sp.]